MATISKGSGWGTILNLASEKILSQVNDKIYQISRELFNSIVRLTPSPSEPGPTATGTLVNNWFPVDGPQFSSDQTTSRSPNGAGSLTRISGLKGRQFLRKDGAVTLSNNLHYAYNAEVMGWPSPEWSGEIGPYRMVARSLQEISARYK